MGQAGGSLCIVSTVASPVGSMRQEGPSTVGCTCADAEPVISCETLVSGSCWRCQSLRRPRGCGCAVWAARQARMKRAHAERRHRVRFAVKEKQAKGWRGGLSIRTLQTRPGSLSFERSSLGCVVLCSVAAPQLVNVVLCHTINRVEASAGLRAPRRTASAAGPAPPLGASRDILYAHHTARQCPARQPDCHAVSRRLPGLGVLPTPGRGRQGQRGWSVEL